MGLRKLNVTSIVRLGGIVPLTTHILGLPLVFSRGFERLVETPREEGIGGDTEQEDCFRPSFL